MGSKYIDSTAIIQVIGCVFNNPSLLDIEDKYIITDNDFSENFHKIVFGAIYKIHESGAKEITLKTISDYLSERPISEGVYKANKGEQWLLKVSKEASDLTFDYYYNRLKKFSLLRAYDNYGIDVSDIYDPDNILDVKKKQYQEDCLDNSSLEEIANKVDEKIDKIRSTYVDDSYEESVQAGEGIFDLIEKFKESPEVGVPLYGPFINTVTRGARLKKFYLRSAATGIGKALPNSTVIPTPSGLKTVKEIKPGDYLFDAFGKPTLVRAVYPQGLKEVWEITFKDGRKAKCCEEHLWSYCTEVQRKEQKINRKFYTKTLKEINELELHQKGRGYNILVPMQKAVEYPSKQYYLQPYTFGLLLGDGSFRYNNANRHKGLRFSSENDELPSAIAMEMNWNYKKNYNYTWMFEDPNNIAHTNVWVEEALKDFPALWQTKSETKFIPREYLEGSIQQRFDLLNGLLDTDGSINKEKGRITYYTVSPQLRDDVIELSLSLGFKATWLEDNHKKDSLPLYQIEIAGTPEDKLKLFKLKRKHDLVESWYNNGKRKESNLFNPIVKIEKLNYSEEMTCFYVDNKEHLFLMNDYIVTHNTRSMIADACYIACDKIYDETFGWIKNGLKQPTLFIATEQDLGEVQTMILAFLSAVNEEHILNGKYEGDEEERVKEAAKIIQESPLYIETVPDFSLADIENKIKKNIREKDVMYVFFDYIHTSMKILEEITKRSGGVRLREDNILFMLSTKLKEICNVYGVFLLTSTQLNGQYVDSETPDQNLLRGAKAIADKVDYGSILLSVTQKDLESLDTVLATNAFDKPTIKISVYKNRRGRYKGIYLWCKADLGTCRINPMFVTNWNYEVIPIDSIKIEVEEKCAFKEEE